MKPEFQVTDSPPAVWPWYKAYCYLLAACQAIPIGFGILAMKLREIPMADYDVPPEPYPLRSSGITLVVMGVVFAALNIAVVYLPRRPWTWVAHLINLISGAMCICPLPVTIPLIIAWIKPDVRRYYSA